jgi:hypothetical protein
VIKVDTPKELVKTFPVKTTTTKIKTPEYPNKKTAALSNQALIYS